MKNPIKSYSFWIKISAAALLIAFSIWMLVDTNSSVFIVLMFTGLVAGIFAIIRVIPLLRTLKSGKARLTCFVEIIIHLLIACLLVYGAILRIQEDNSWFSNFMDENYRFVIAVFFLTRVISYFMCTVLFKEETDKIKFWVHIALIFLACLMCSLSDIKSQTIALIIAVIALICSLGLIVDGAVGYNRYRKQIQKDREKIKEEKTQKSDDAKDAPAKEENIIPMIDEQPKDNITIN